MGFKVKILVEIIFFLLPSASFFPEKVSNKTQLLVLLLLSSMFKGKLHGEVLGNLKKDRISEKGVTIIFVTDIPRIRVRTRIKALVTEKENSFPIPVLIPARSGSIRIIKKSKRCAFLKDNLIVDLLMML